MRQIRLIALGIVSFFAVLMGGLLAPGTFVNRALSVALCTVFSFNSTVCTVNLARSGDRVVAATPPAVERNISDWLVQRAPGEFDDAPSVPSRSNPQAPPFPQDPGPNQPVRPDFDNPSIPQPNQAQSKNYLFTGLWAFMIYASPSDSKPFSLNFIQVNDNGNEYVSSLCQKDCNINQFRASSATHVPQEKSLTTDYENLNFEILPSTDNQAMWGKILNKATGESIYFTMFNLIKIATKNNEKQQYTQTINQFGLELANANYTNNIKTYRQLGDQLIKVPSLSPTNQFYLLAQGIPLVRWVTKTISDGLKVLVTDKTVLTDITEINTKQSQTPANQNPNKVQAPQGVDQYTEGHNPHRKNQQGRDPRQNQRKENQSGNRALNEVEAPLNTLEQGSGWIKDINNNSPKWFAAFFAPILAALFDTISNSKADAAENPPQPNPQPSERQNPIDDAAKMAALSSGIRYVNASSWGDPHLTTFDGQRYDHHAIGEFVLTRSKNRQFEIQVREAPYKAINTAAINTAAAIKVGNTRVALYADGFPDDQTSIPLRIDGKPVDLQGTQNLPGGGSITRTGNLDWVVQWPTGKQAMFHIRGEGKGSTMLEITPAVTDRDRGQLEGLLGNFNGNPSDDFMSRDGRVIAENKEAMNIARSVLNNFNVSQYVPIQLDKATELFLESIHKQFGDSWRISTSESLFDYPPGKNTDSFTNHAFPNGFVVLRMLAPQAVQMAEEACRKAEVPSDRLEGCLFDVAATGDSGFASIAANVLKNEVKQRVQQEIRNRVPVPIPLPF
ncbi:MAG: VWD domain-containing protein [Microcoleus sp. PH2017_10_PVI_O_A]|uniref:VWD domain-containing protein n=1 Tax=unclassified Microcoleus TaxID=2642155 RepID=UPI001DE681B2|nr:MULTISPECIES: VWD domain-containing protein [unclassified Microcoleus]TAE82300.1 MAG: hypothetical protein EAZ83_12725 [Oscillatoriales cyanobacterium]MCC3406826.1 VWD domain-containing protein [Microcoleus sp. PH2017_10_PVI_O_A]MCC3460961.1 VWD domain-containing protein [Microcoleus sp. PH2017_11_PCY_U_A]MCC3479482.1 VWD domain-containing protein [Microcoleus sp. PH2017_12_PCY_D_A]MCC3560325.1 VWD domain-containing protein [Microcoleus sp. PH2017_27_LUM_O_A]